MFLRAISAAKAEFDVSFVLSDALHGTCMQHGYFADGASLRQGYNQPWVAGK
jgi:hypothetical protein